MKLRMLVIAPVAALALAACGEGDVSAEDEGAELQEEVTMRKEEVRDAARSACGAIPVNELAGELGVDLPADEEIAERFAEPWPSELQDAVREGCLAGLDQG